MHRIPMPRPLLPSVACLLLFLAAGSSGLAGGLEPASAAILPPELPWDGASRSLMAKAEDPWITPSEATGLTATPRYAETMAWLDELVAAAPELSLVTLGTSAEGREIRMVIASAEGASTPEQLRVSGKPLLLAHAGIHSGEIDGKDAGLMLLRDMTVGGSKKELLRSASFLFVPILSVDGHERFSAWGRINQRGPEEMGWRTNARNQNLNRDFAKLDTPEVRALVAAFERYRPDFYLDFHVTDGADYQYDITYGYSGTHAHSPAIAGWLDSVYRPAVDSALQAMGHVPGPLVFLADSADPTQGNVGWTASPRFSNGYGDLRHLPSVLVENHSLKPYDQRVLGTYVLLEATLRTLGSQAESLRKAVAEDRARRRDPVPLDWTLPEGEPETVPFLGVASRQTLSPISGSLRLEWTGEPVSMEIPLLELSEPAVTASRPAAYWIPATWPEVIERLELHGVRTERLAEAREVEVELYRLLEPALEEAPFEGHARVTLEGVEAERHRWRFPAGSVRVPTDQPLGNLAVVLLEPMASDSFFRWGFFLEVLQQTEYFEAYVIEPMAEGMLAEDEALAGEFRKALASDSELAASPRLRLEWFYRRTPFFDQRWNLYPVGREVAP